MINVGIDRIAFYTSHYALELKELARVRGVDPDKFLVGLGQHSMSVPPPDEDIVTMAANAASRVIQNQDVNEIEMVIFATETGIDQSKAAGIYVHDLLKLPARCRVIEMKQACYAATMALQLALSFIRQHPHKKVLLIASDIARYGLNTPGESSQGCGAVAMLLSAHPQLLSFDSEYGVITESVMDFWRPNYTDAAFVEGKYSSLVYMSMLERTWQQYCTLSQRYFKDHAYYLYHVSVPRLVEKAHSYLAKLNQEKLSDIQLTELNYTLEYGRKIGNCYTAALYLSFISLLERAKENLSGKRLGFYSYGSGCVAEFFSGVVQSNYKNKTDSIYHEQLFKQRKFLTYDEYEKFYTFDYPKDGRRCDIPQHQTGQFRLARIENHKRIYECV